MRLEANPFDYRITEDRRILVSRGGRQVKVIAGAQAERLIDRFGVDSDTDEELLARATGNYRRGNERRGGQHPA